ncbi:MAG: hypothetical protein QMD05_07005 [Candidatus Brocadiaceae bacterium]|nr:hypothetical protein [Candidatus Brocadiaceae bacterium]
MCALSDGDYPEIGKHGDLLFDARSASGGNRLLIKDQEIRDSPSVSDGLRMTFCAHPSADPSPPQAEKGFGSGQNYT